MSTADLANREEQYRLFYQLQASQPKRTYAQHCEDLATIEILGRPPRNFIDIGAADGVTCSNTLLWALQGAQGLSFEPIPTQYHLLQALYTYNPSITCINEGVSDSRKTANIQSDGLLSFVLDTEDKGLTGALSPFMNPGAEILTVSFKPLAYWLNQYPEFRHTDVVSLDVEGHELSVLHGIDFQSFRSGIFIVETHSEVADGTAWLHRDYAEIDSYFKKHGYIATLKNPINTFWIYKDLLDRASIERVKVLLPDYAILG